MTDRDTAAQIASIIRRIEVLERNMLARASHRVIDSIVRRHVLMETNGEPVRSPEADAVRRDEVKTPPEMMPVDPDADTAVEPIVVEEPYEYPVQCQICELHFTRADFMGHVCRRKRHECP